MPSHLFLLGADLSSVTPAPEHETFLRQELETIRAQSADGDISASACVSGALTELLLEKVVVTDWVSLMEDHLSSEAGPLAYSEKFGQRLYKFAGQWKQSPVHAIHARWWIEKACEVAASYDYAALVGACVQTSGWIYNQNDSETRVRNRMRSELMMSQAMGVEILRDCGALDERRKELVATLADATRTEFLSAEYFRLVALEYLDALSQAPAALEQVLAACEVDPADDKSGYCDFSPRLKVADYMGTAHRSGRDRAVASPLSALHASHINETAINDKERTTQRLSAYRGHLDEIPLDIKAFHIRDLHDIPFGEGVTALEVIAASALIRD